MNRFLSLTLAATALLTSIQAHSPEGATAATAQAEAAVAAAMPTHSGEHHHSGKHHDYHKHAKHHATPTEMAKACMDEMAKIKESAVNLEAKADKDLVTLYTGKAELEHGAILNPDIPHSWKHKSACMRYLNKAKAVIGGHRKHHHSAAHTAVTTGVPAVVVTAPAAAVVAPAATAPVAVPAAAPTMVAPATPASH